MSSDPPPPTAPSALALLREQRDLRRYVIGQGISMVGLWMQQVAQAVVVVDLAGAAAKNTVMATVTLASSAPMVIFLLSGGVIADRYDRRKVLIVTQLALAILAFVYAALLGTGALRLSHVYALAFLLGTVAAFDMPAVSAMVPQLVPPQSLAMAVAINQALFHGARVLGPVVAGFLLKFTSPAMAFVANGVSYFAVIASLLIIRPRPVAKRPASGGWGAYKEGLRFALREPKVRALLGYTTVVSAFVFPFLIVFVAVFVKQVLHSNDDGLGFTMAATGVGAVSGAIFLMFVKERRGRMIVIASLVVAATLAAVSQARSIAVLMALCVPFAMGVSTTMGLSNTLVQTLTPDHLRGRVMGLWAMIFVGVMPAGALILAPVADVIGLRPALLMSAGALLLIGLPWLWRQRVWHI
jgi:MFS family permease